VVLADQADKLVGAELLGLVLEEIRERLDQVEVRLREDLPRGPDEGPERGKSASNPQISTKSLGVR